jgi:hypothetical protein
MPCRLVCRGTRIKALFLADDAPAWFAGVVARIHRRTTMSVFCKVAFDDGDVVEDMELHNDDFSDDLDNDDAWCLDSDETLLLRYTQRQVYARDQIPFAQRCNAASPRRRYLIAIQTPLPDEEGDFDRCCKGGDSSSHGSFVSGITMLFTLLSVSAGLWILLCGGGDPGERKAGFPFMTREVLAPQCGWYPFSNGSALL